MNIFRRTLFRSIGIVVFLLINQLLRFRRSSESSLEDSFANANRVRLHYLIAGKGDPVILIHGYAHTSHMWRPLMVELAKTHTVTAPPRASAYAKAQDRVRALSGDYQVHLLEIESHQRTCNDLILFNG